MINFIFQSTKSWLKIELSKFQKKAIKTVLVNDNVWVQQTLMDLQKVIQKIPSVNLSIVSLSKSKRRKTPKFLITR